MSKLLKKVLSSLCCLASTGLLSNAGSNSKRVRLPNGEAEVRGAKVKEVNKAKGSTRKKLFKKLGQNDVRVNGKRAKIKINGKWHPAIKIGGGIFLVLAVGGTIWYCVSGENSGEKEASNEDKNSSKEASNKEVPEKEKKELLEKKGGELEEKRKKLEQVAKDCGFTDSSLMNGLIGVLVKIKVKISYANVKDGFRVQVRDDDDSGTITCDLKLNYEKNVGTEGEGLRLPLGMKGVSYPVVWLKEDTLMKNNLSVKNGESILYSLFSNDKKDENVRGFKMIALGLVARQIAYAFTSKNMDNLSKNPGDIKFGDFGGLDFCNFVRFVKLVDCVCEWGKAP